MVATHWLSYPVSQTASSTGGFTTTGDEWKMSPSFQKTGVVRASLGRSRCSPRIPDAQVVALCSVPVHPRSGP
jgi:hypothetical protein